MADYKKMYFTLFHAVTDVVERLDSNLTENGVEIGSMPTVVWAKGKLKRAQLVCEEIYMDSDGEGEYKGDEQPIG